MGIFTFLLVLLKLSAFGPFSHTYVDKCPDYSRPLGFHLSLKSGSSPSHTIRLLCVSQDLGPTLRILIADFLPRIEMSLHIV